MNYRPLLIMCLALLLVATQFGNGCASDDGGSSSSSGTSSTSGGAADRTGTGLNADGRLPGDRAPTPLPRRLPRNSDLVREGFDKIRWTADLDGTVYVYDVDADHIAWTGRVRRGQEIVVDPKRDSVMVGDEVVYQDNLGKDAQHRIYFATTSTQRDRGDVISRDDDDDGDGRTSRDPAGAIPTAARPLADGRGTLEIKRAPADGTIYVYDAETHRIMLKRTIQKGDSFQIVPTEDFIRENGKRTGTLRLDADHRHVLYFKASSE